MGTEFSTAKPDLQAIEVLTPSNDDILQRKAGAWVNRTIAQFKTDLAYTIPVASDTAYDATSWNANTDVPTKNAVRDKIEAILAGVTFTGDVVVPDEAYDATAWNGSLEVPTKNAIRDKIESMTGGSGDVVGPGAATDNAIARFDSTTGKLIQNSGATVNDSGDVVAGRYLEAAPGGGSDTRIRFTGGTAGLGSWFGAGAVTLNTADTPRFLIGASGYQMETANSGMFAWYSGAGVGSGSLDSAILRGGPSIVKISDSSTGGAALESVEMTAPAAPAANGWRIFAEDNGSGKTRLMVIFSSGAAQQIAIQP